MTQPTYQIRQCTDQSCRLRFPMAVDARLGERCPRCRAVTVVVVEVNAPSERTAKEEIAGGTGGACLPIEALLDNVRSLFNVGSIFRSADGAGLRRLHLCGITPTPENPKLAKTALGAEKGVAWRYHTNGVDALQRLRNEGYAIWALEEQAGAESLFTVTLPTQPLLLVVGSEVTGVDPGILQQCDKIVAIPMYGVKRSLNVATAFGVAAVLLSNRWQAMEKPGF
jgi:23S rRNA (guanosine2251-2'-O)-methyltransferase